MRSQHIPSHPGLDIWGVGILELISFYIALGKWRDQILFFFWTVECDPISDQWCALIPSWWVRPKSQNLAHEMRVAQTFISSILAISTVDMRSQRTPSRPRLDRWGWCNIKSMISSGFSSLYVGDCSTLYQINKTRGVLSSFVIFLSINFFNPKKIKSITSQFWVYIDQWCSHRFWFFFKLLADHIVSSIDWEILFHFKIC